MPRVSLPIPARRAAGGLGPFQAAGGGKVGKGDSGPQLAGRLPKTLCPLAAGHMMAGLWPHSENPAPPGPLACDRGQGSPRGLCPMGIVIPASYVPCTGESARGCSERGSL